MAPALLSAPVTTEHPRQDLRWMDGFVVGLIGLGDMGKLYAEKLSAAGWKILGCDKEENFDQLCKTYAGHENIKICRNGHHVSRASDFILYSVDALALASVIPKYAPSTKLGAIVGGQTSCKDPEVALLDAHLPADVDIICCHSLHGPLVDPTGQPLVLVQHRASTASLRKVEKVLSCLGSRYVYLCAEEHDRITADTQAVTHAAFLSMGKAWHANGQFPWELSRYVGGMENVKINLMLRIYAAKGHTYAGLAILNPEARKQIAQYACSVTDLYKLMLVGDLEPLRSRVFAARDLVFGGVDGLPERWGSAPLLQPELLEEFTIGQKPDSARPNNHLSLLAMVDCWAALGVVPYDHMLCSTPPFRLRLGVTEHLFRNTDLLEAALRVAVQDRTYRSDDLEFTFAARGWAECVSLRNFDTWNARFESTQAYFKPRAKEAIAVGSSMLKRVEESLPA